MATDAPDTLRELFFDADRRVGQGLATYGGLDATAFSGLETIEDVSADATAMDLLAASAAYQEVVRSVTAMEVQAADSTAMNAVSESQTAMEAVASSTSMNIVAASSTARDAIGTDSAGYDVISTDPVAIGKLAAGAAGLDPTTYDDIDAVVGEQTARDAVSENQTGFDVVVASPIAVGKFVAALVSLDPTAYTDIDAVATDSSAMDAVASSAAAMDAVASSSPAKDAIGTTGVGYDKISTDPMAIGKYVAGLAGFDPTAYADINAVATDSGAMDVVASSSTPKDAVSASATAENAIAQVSMAVGKLVAGLAGLDPTAYTDIDAVATDSSAMDAVASSSAATDLVRQSNPAQNAVRGAPMAIGKFVAGLAGLDPTAYTDIGAVAGEQSALSTVVSSSTAINEMVSSVAGRTAAIGSQYALSEIWPTSAGSSAWLNSGFNIAGKYDQSIESGGPTGNGKFIQIETQGQERSERGWTIDLGGYSTLEWKMRVPVAQFDGGDPYARVYLGSNEIFETAMRDPDWVTRSVDVSGYSGNTTLSVEGSTEDGFGSIEIKAQFGDFVLS